MTTGTLAVNMVLFVAKNGLTSVNVCMGTKKYPDNAALHPDNL